MDKSTIKESIKEFVKLLGLAAVGAFWLYLMLVLVVSALN